MRGRGSVAVWGVFLLVVLLALLWGLGEMGLWLSAAARARMAAEAGVHVALSARDWWAAQRDGRPRLDPAAARALGETAVRSVVGDRPAAWAVAADPAGVVAVTVTLTVTETTLGWLGLPGPFAVTRSAAGRLEWWDAP